MYVLKITFSAILGVIALAAILILAGHFGFLNTVKPFVVESGSMAPSISHGSVVLVRGVNSYNPGDIITYKQEGSIKKIITHRIVSLEYLEDGQLTYRTRGDANKESEVDKWRVRQTDIIGKVYVRIPFLGFAIDLAKQPKGFILLVIIPATIIVYEEFRSLKRELLKLFRKRKEEGILHPLRLPKAVFLIPVIGGVFVFSSLTVAFFSDQEKSENNLISAATSFGPSATPTPTPTPITDHLVINEVYYDPDSLHMEGVSPSENDFEWVEIYNPTGVTVNLKNWKVMDNFGPERSISENDRDLVSGDFVILAKADNVRTIWAIPNEKFIAIGQRLGNGLANGDDRVILKDDAGNTVDQMSYGEDDITAFDPSAPDVLEGHSLEREPDGTDTDSAADFVDREAPSPGT